jgi:hypothetical protein
MRKPTDLSVTDLPCQCGYLEDHARDPRFPLRFDEKSNEYYFDFVLPKGAPLSLLIYHCPMCGGVASESKMEGAHAIVSEGERKRVYELIGGLKTVDDIVLKFGAPDRDVVFSLPEDFAVTVPGILPVDGPIRALTYEHLSQTADVQFLVYSNKRIEASITRKYLGEPGE